MRSYADVIMFASLVKLFALDMMLTMFKLLYTIDSLQEITFSTLDDRNFCSYELKLNDAAIS